MSQRVLVARGVLVIGLAVLSVGLAWGAGPARNAAPGVVRPETVVVAPQPVLSGEAPAAAAQTTLRQGPAITLAKTVGTTPGVCAATSEITVPIGTDVYYCFVATNTGDVTLNFHDLVDDQLGTVLNDFAYTLAPAASSSQVIVPDTISAETVNTATWTAVTAIGGYVMNSAAPYSYVSINATGAALALADDGEANITSPFPFTFFGVTSTALRVGNNGGILFNATTGDVGVTNATLPAASPALAILPFWDDIDSDTGDVYWEVQGAAPNRQLIIEWYNRPHFSNIGSATFEVILFETTNEIKFQYADVDFGNASYDFGASATVGINLDAATAVQYSFNQAIVANGQAILFSPETVGEASAQATATVHVVAPDIDVSPLSLTSAQAPDTVVSQTLTIGNVGGAPLDWLVLEAEEGVAQRPGVVAAPEPVFSVPAEVTSEKDCAAFANYPGREPLGWAEHCGASLGDALVVPSRPALRVPTSTGYAQDIGYISDNFVSFALNNFTGQTVVGTNTNAYYGMDFDSTGTTLYALNDTTDQLGTIDLTTGAFTSIVACAEPGGTNWTGLTIDPVTNAFWASTSANLYRIDAATCSPSLVGPFNIAGGIMIDIALGPQGVMYGHDIGTDSIYTIDTTTGAATLVGVTGYGANYAQGMDFDNEDGTLYIWLYIGSGANHFGIVDLSTGAVTPLASSAPQGEFEGATQTLALCAPADYPWLSLSPLSGTTAPAGSSSVSASFDSTGLALGTYTGQLCVRSNDPDAGPGNGTSLVVVPVSLTVSDAPLGASLTATKTVTGSFAPGGAVTYTIVLSNAGPGAQGDNPGDEFTDVLPASLTATGASATAGTVQRIGNAVTWNGALAAGASVTITVTATVNVVPAGTEISNQGQFAYDSTGDGANNAGGSTDDPALGGATDPTVFTVFQQQAEPIPTLGSWGLAVMILLLAAAAVVALRRLA